MKIQSASADPGIDTAPRSVLQVPMTDNVPTVSGGVSEVVSMLPVASDVSGDEEVNEEEDDESGHDDDEWSCDDPTSWSCDESQKTLFCRVI